MIGEPRSVIGYTVAVANSGRYGGGMQLAPDARLDDGLLELMIISDMPRLRFLRTLPSVFKGEHVHRPEFALERARRVRIAASRPFTLYADGDPIAELPAEIEVLPAAVQTIVPAAADGTATVDGRGVGEHPALGRGVGMSTLDAKVAAAQTVGRLARRAGRGGGTSLPGKVLTRLAPDAIGRLAERLPDGSAVISATNGKTTTAAMVASVLGRQGRRVVANGAGANMAGGVASALLDAARWGGEIDGQFGLFEVDEFWMDTVVPALEPRCVLLGNLFRDQLDRYGELETIADRWAAMVLALPSETALALNADDPLIADLGRGRGAVTYFGVEDRSLAIAEMQHASDSKHCRNCGAAYVYEAIYLGHLGAYACPSCGRRRPDPTVSAQRRLAAWHPLGELHAACRRAGGRRRSCRCRVSTTSTTRSPRRRCAARSASRPRRSPTACNTSVPRSGARSGSPSATTSWRCC